MKEIMIRFIIVYFYVLFSMKLVGKRQIGEMQMSELVAAFFISELASFTVTNRKIPIYYGLIPILLMILIEMLVSFLAVKSHILKRVLDFSPSVLIRDGEILEKELLKNRITLDELFSLLRLCGYYDLSKVRFAILEPNGQLSVVPYSNADSISPSDLSIQVPEVGFSVAIINDGKVNEKALSAIGQTKKWLKRILNREGVSGPKEVFLLSSDYLGNYKIVKKTSENNRSEFGFDFSGDFEYSHIFLNKLFCFQITGGNNDLNEWNCGFSDGHLTNGRNELQGVDALDDA